MMKTLLVSMLTLLAPLSLYAHAQMIQINNVPIEGILDYKYGISEVDMTEGNINTGPVMSYIATAVTGEITLDRRNNMLDSSLQSGANFTMAYMNKKFIKCNILRREINSSSTGQTVKYLFRTFFISS